MTNEKNTDNNNPKSDVALWSHTPAEFLYNHSQKLSKHHSLLWVYLSLKFCICM